MTIMSFLLSNVVPLCGFKEPRRIILWLNSREHPFLTGNLPHNIFQHLSQPRERILRWAMEKKYFEIRSKADIFLDLILNGTTIVSEQPSDQHGYKSLVQGSDLTRFILMYKYAGVYVDVDVVFLRDFSPLFALARPFVTR